MNYLKRVEPHLVSDDLFVQQLVNHALSDYPNVPAKWTNQLIEEAISNKEKEVHILIYLNNHAINEEGLKFLIEGYKRTSKDNQHLYYRLIQSAPPSILWKYRDEVGPILSNDWWKLISLVINADEEEMWKEFGGILNELEDLTYYHDEAYLKGKLILQALVQKGWLKEQQIDLVMNEELNNDCFSYGGILMVHAIGLLQIEKYIPILANLLARDEDILLEEVAEALTSFQSDEVVEAVTPYAKDPDTSIFAISIIENTKTPFAFQTLQSLYEEVDDEDSKALIVEALCHFFDEQALPQIEDFIQHGYETVLIDAEELLYGFYTAMGKSHPMLKEWKEIALMKEKMLQKEEVNHPTVQKSEKIGRNDPCPCGSGKKYKKCCLN